MSKQYYMTPILLKKSMCRQCQFFGHAARGSAGKELKECVESSGTKIGRRTIRWINTVSEMAGEKGIGKLLKLAENRLERRTKNTF